MLDQSDHPSPPHIAYIALGSNLGDRARSIASAVEQLQSTPSISVIRVATPLENPAVGGPPDSPAFLNSAAEVRTSLDAVSLLHRLHAIEHSLGRIRRRRWEPRPIDLDLLLYGRQIIDTDLPDNGHLTVPHPRLHERLFVLRPLAEIAPRAEHPVFHATVAQLLSRLLENMRQ